MLNNGTKVIGGPLVCNTALLYFEGTVFAVLGYLGAIFTHFNYAFFNGKSHQFR